MEETTNLFIGLPNAANLQLADPELVAYYTDLKERTLWLTGEINSEWTDIVQHIIRFNREDKMLPIKQRQPIKLMILSEGGSLEISDELVNIIELSKTPIYGYGLGMVASGASMIYLACHKRYALPNTYFIIHKGSANNIGGDYAQIAAYMKDYDKQIEKMVKFYKTHTSFSEEVIEQKMSGADWYVYVDEALENNIVNEVVTDINVMI